MFLKLNDVMSGHTLMNLSVSLNPQQQQEHAGFSTHSSSSSSLPPQQQQQQQQQQLTATITPATRSQTPPPPPSSTMSSPPSQASVSSPPPPSYKMSPNVFTMKDLWREFFDGLPNAFSRGPKVDELEKKYGKKWRMSDRASQFFNRRNRIIKQIQSKIPLGTPEEDRDTVGRDLAARYDLKMKSESRSLDWIAKNYKEFFDGTLPPPLP